jgi:hypothetical protein
MLVRAYQLGHAHFHDVVTRRTVTAPDLVPA